ncbi:hypothetical protein Q3G72_003472 [Acer saccharum]|nr:hypothetical protein Q3G72_003472 [Acer saccharum]
MLLNATMNWKCMLQTQAIKDGKLVMGNRHQNQQPETDFVGVTIASATKEQIVEPTAPMKRFSNSATKEPIAEPTASHEEIFPFR